MSVSIVSANVRGLGNATKRHSIFNYYRKRCNILCLQETHSTKESIEFWRNEWGGDIYTSHGESDSRGVAILINPQYDISVENIQQDQDGRVLAMDCKKNDYTFSICVIYAPNTDKPEFFVKVVEILQKMNDNRIMVGDFNLVLEDIDSKNVKTNNEKASCVVKNIMEELMLVDIWRMRNNEKKRYTHIRAKPKFAGRCLDFAVIESGICDKIGDCFYLPGILSDHSSMYLCLDVDVNERGKGYWKFNCSHLKLPEYLELINKRLIEIEPILENMGVIEGWEFIKFEMRRISKKFAKERASDTELIISYLSEKIVEMKDRGDALDEKEAKILLESKIDLDEILLKKAESLLFRTRCNWYEFEGKSSKYFYGLKKRRYDAKTCHTLIGENERVVKKDSEILDLQMKYYKKLYTKNSDVNFNIVNQSNLKVPQKMWEEQNQEFTYEEIAKAVKQLNNQKCLGNDVIPVNFYKVFWAKLSKPFMCMLNYAYEEGKMPETMMRGVINLIPKTGKDSRFLKNLRPLTLLNTDYKIIEKALANRLIPALDILISCDQRGFLRDRRIATNIRKIFDVITYAQNEEIAALILSLDFEKCFDKIEFEAIYGAMSYFGIAPYVIQWTKTMYEGFTVNVQNNGKFSENFKIERSVHQGGPCSAYYFLLCAELLAIALKEDQEIQGVMVNEIMNLLNQYADDADMFLMFEKRTVEKVSRCLGKVS